MKRKGHFYNRIMTASNLVLADKKARRGKSRQKSVISHDRRKWQNLKLIYLSLKDHSYTTSEYKTFVVREPKERVIYRLPYNPDRITHWAIMNVIKPTLTSVFTADTYSCIKGRGIHKAVEKIKACLFDRFNTAFFLKIDIRKFYPSINHDVLKSMLLRKFKDTQLLNLLYGIIDSAVGLPIGNYLSQYLANFYLAYFDHWVKEVQKVVYYFRYADDMVFFAPCKKFLHKLLANIKEYLGVNLKLELKKNYRVAPIRVGLDMLGYVFYWGYTKVRKRVKQACARMLIMDPNPSSIYSYLGWFSHANTINLTNKLIYGRA